MSSETEKLKQKSKEHFEVFMAKWDKGEVRVENAMLGKALGEILVLNDKCHVAHIEGYQQCKQDVLKILEKVCTEYPNWNFIRKIIEHEVQKL